MWPKTAAPAGVLAPSRSKSHRVPGSLAPGFSPARMPQSWRGCCPVSFSNKNREARRAAGVSPYLSNRLFTRRTALGRRRFYEVRGGSPTQRRLVPLRSRWAAGPPGSAPGQGKAGAPARHPRPQPSSSIQRPPVPPPRV